MHREFPIRRCPPRRRDRRRARRSKGGYGSTKARDSLSCLPSGVPGGTRCPAVAQVGLTEEWRRFSALIGGLPGAHVTDVTLGRAESDGRSLARRSVGIRSKI